MIPQVIGGLSPRKVALPRFSYKQALLPYSPQKPSESPLSRRHNQWPWRGFAFLSDASILLGLMGIKGPAKQLGLVSIPYYLYAIARPQSSESRLNEILYQLTANGLFPFLNVSFGMKMGPFLQKIAPIFKKQALAEMAGGLMGLLILTPLVGDPASHQLIQWVSKKRRAKNHD